MALAARLRFFGRIIYYNAAQGGILVVIVWFVVASTRGLAFAVRG
jgi:hypothetical protein